MVLVSVDDEVGSIFVQNVPQCFHRRRWAMHSGAEQGTVPVGKRARLPVVLEIRAQPLFLCSCLGKKRSIEQKLAVECNHMPFPDVIAVIPFSGRAGFVTEVRVVSGSACRLEVMVPG